MTFNHEKLKVYQRAILFNAKVCDWTSCWDARHAICDQMDRAAGSMVENNAIASASFSAMKSRSLDYAIGSALECAACLDLAGIKQFLDLESAWTEKEELSQVVRMLVGLRKAWSSQTKVRETEAKYGITTRVLFHHEELDVYRVALEVDELLANSEAICSLSSATFRRLDENLTGMILNIAEGNGRFSEADQFKFLGVSHESAIKLAARLDLCVIRGSIPVNDADVIKEQLARVSAMILAMLTDFREQEDSTMLTTKLPTKEASTDFIYSR